MMNVTFCFHCGEGVTNFCRSRMGTECPNGLKLPGKSKMTTIAITDITPNTTSFKLATGDIFLLTYKSGESAPYIFTFVKNGVYSFVSIHEASHVLSNETNLIYPNSTKTEFEKYLAGAGIMSYRKVKHFRIDCELENL